MKERMEGECCRVDHIFMPSSSKCVQCELRNVKSEMTKLLTARIPATSANIGPGFDCMGIALDLWNTFELHEGNGNGITVESHGEGEDVLPNDKSHLGRANHDR